MKPCCCTYKLTLLSVNLLALAITCGAFMNQPAVAADITAGNVARERVLSADADVDNWMTYGRTYGDQRFTPLEQINTGNVNRLGLAWYADIPSRRRPVGYAYRSGWGSVYERPFCPGVCL